jgi:hypothetical protein
MIPRATAKRREKDPLAGRGASGIDSPESAIPWTNGQVKHMNRTIEEAMVKCFHDQSHDPPKAHLQTFLMACDFARRSKTLESLTPCESIRKAWTKETDRLRIDPNQQTWG